MRALGRAILVSFAVVTCLLAIRLIESSLHWNEFAATFSGRIASALPSTSYHNVDDQWLEFALSGSGTGLRIRTNAVVDSDTHIPAGDERWYAFEYQLLAPNGKVLRQGIYHHKTRVTLIEDSDRGQVSTRSFLLDPDIKPTDGRSMLLDLRTIGPATALRIRPVEKAAELKQLLFRVYEKTPNPVHKLGYLWDRLGTTKKVRLAQGSIYGLEYVRDQEKQNLLREEWRPIGPMGVSGKTYEAVKLYIDRELNGRAVDDTPMPYGLYCDATTSGLIPVPEGNWSITLDVSLLGNESDEDSEMTVYWYGENANQRWQKRLQMRSGRLRLPILFDGGQLEIKSPSPIVVRARGSNDKNMIELTPEPVRVRAYLLDAGKNVDLKIDHLGELATPFKVDIRAVFDTGMTKDSRALTYELLDDHDRVVDVGHLTADLVKSNYDRLVRAEPGFVLSDPVSRYFSLSTDVATVRFSSKTAVLLVFYSRPPTLAKQLRVPEDYRAYSSDQVKIPGWFLLRPDGDRQLRVEFRSMLITVQQRPPDTDPRLLSGDYDWKLFHPTGSWRARHVLVPRKSELPVNDQNLAAIYRELDTDRPIRVRLRRMPGHQDVNPNLLYLRERKTPLDVRVLLGDRLYASTQIAGQRGLVKLPPAEPGSKQLTVVANEAVRWFVNQADSQGAAHLRRLTMQLSSKGLTYEYQKESTEAEVLSAELYTLSPARTTVRITISGPANKNPGPWQEWTFRNRLFDLRPDTDNPVPILDTNRPFVFGGQRFVLPLGSDLPPGAYRLRFAVEDGTESYLTLYRLVPGRKEQRIFSRERVYAQKAGL